MKKILVTGGTGFIGYHLVKHLLKDKKVRIVVVDNLQRGAYDEAFKELLHSKRVQFIRGDLTKLGFFKKLPTGFTHVYHLAAVNGTKHFYAIPHEVLRVNVVSLINVLDWIRSQKKKPKLCFTSSNEAYAGALESFGILPIPTPENVPLVVSDTYNPRWSYGASKLIGEEFVIFYAAAYKFSAVIVRPHNFYGPRAGKDHVIPELIKRISEKQDPFVVYSPEETRSFCYIEDAVVAMQLLMDSKKTDTHPVQTVHVGNNEETKIIDLAQTLSKITGYTPKKIEVKPSLPGSVKRRLPDVQKIEKLVGWKHTTSLADGLKKAYEWYSTHI